MTRKRVSKIEIDMFPFLSVLCSVIGVMVLLIVLVMSSRAEEVEESQSFEVPPPLPILELEQPTEIGVPDAVYDKMHGDILGLAGQLGERQAELQSLNQLILELEELIAIKQDEALATSDGEGMVTGVELDRPDDVVLIPAKNQKVTKKARFVEVTVDEYILQPEDQHFPVAELKRKRSSLRKFLDQVDEAKLTEYLVFLIHENGIEAFNEIETLLLKEYPHDSPKMRGTLSRIDFGKELFSQDWRFVRRSPTPANSDKD